MIRARRPWLARALSKLVIGEDAETLRGDLEEAFHARVRERGNSLRTRVEHIGDVAASLGHWWWAACLRGTRHLGALVRSRNLLQSGGVEMRQLLRQLIRRPAHSAIVIMTLALGIGATTTIYTVVDVMLVRPLPYRDADRLVVIGNTNPTRPATSDRDGLPRLETMSLPSIELLRNRTRVVDQVATLERNGWISSDPATGITEIVEVATVSENMLEMLAAKPLMGRLLTRDDAPVNGQWNTVIPYQTWQRKFAGDPNIIGKTTKGGTTLTVVGVLPKDFYPPAALIGSAVDYWIYLNPAQERYRQPRRRNLHVLARLSPGVSIDEARRELSSAHATVVRDAPEGNRLPGGLTLGVAANSLRDETIGSSGRPALLIFGASILLLLLACLNASNLLLVRGLERAGEMAVRQAIGAGRARLTAGLVLESLTLAVAGGIVGLGLAAIGVGLFRRFGPSSVPMITDVTMNTRVAIAGFMLSVVVGLVIGVVPAIRGGAVDLLSTLRSSSLALTHGGARLRAGLAATQLALALILGVGASLLFRSFMKVTSEDLGFQPARLVAFNVPLKSPSHVEAWDRVIAQLRTIPGVAEVAIASNLPFQAPSWMPRVQLAEQAGEMSSAGIPGYIVTPTFFATAGIRVANGRAFDQGDRPESPRVAIVNRTFVTTLLANRNPIGARLRLVNEGSERGDVEVVGVVDDVVQARVQDGIAPAIYVPYTQAAALPTVIISTQRAMSADALEPALKGAIAAAGYAGLPLRGLGSMPERIAETRVAPRFHALLIGAFAATAILLSAIGLYGTLAFAVRSRKKELGIRIALGAAPEQIHRIVIRQGLSIFAIGGGGGLLGALGISRLLEGFLYRLSPIDPFSFASAIVGAGLVVLLAALGPAMRAGRIDPMTSIRAEG